MLAIIVGVFLQIVSIPCHGQCKSAKYFTTPMTKSVIIFCAVIMRWNGVNITGIPTFIYHDELGSGNISDLDRQGSLICSSAANSSVFWQRVDEVNVNFHNRGSFQQIERPSFSQLALGLAFTAATPRTESFVNGLWPCTGSGARLHVGIYARAGKAE